VTDRPYTLDAPTVRRILAGEQAQIRRPMRIPKSIQRRSPREDVRCYTNGSTEYPGSTMEWATGMPPGALVSCNDGTCQRLPCPLGHQGDCLWLREQWAPVLRGADEDQVSWAALYTDWTTSAPTERIGEWEPGKPFTVEHSRPVDPDWRRASTMPRWAARVVAEIVGVRVERGDGGWEWNVDLKLCALNGAKETA
jgi:hypothetical protein